MEAFFFTGGHGNELAALRLPVVSLETRERFIKVGGFKSREHYVTLPNTEMGVMIIM